MRLRLSLATLPAALGVAAVLALTGPAFATVSTPPPGSPVRTAILDSVRGMVESEVGGPVEFVVNQIRVLGEWAYVDLTPQRPGGGPIYYIYSRYQAAVDAGALDDSAVALLRDTPAGWLVYEYSLGATDVVWIDWMGRYPAPNEVFPPQGGAVK